jgi:GTP-binding protein
MLRLSRLAHLPRTRTRAPCVQRRVFSASSFKDSPDRRRNIAIIAHVDHGKTTLVDCLLKQSGTVKSAQADMLGDRIMDSNQLEKERGITILAKTTSVLYGEHRINIVDTPGHADFGGEVERVLSMVEGVALVVDATEGPMTQTRFVLNKALTQRLKPVVVINKADRHTARFGEVENEIFDLFASLAQSDDQLEYPVVYASAREGWAVRSMEDQKTNMQPLFDQILETVPPPLIDTEQPFRMLTTQIESNSFLGRLLLGKIKSGRLRVGDPLHALDAEGRSFENARVLKIFMRHGIEQLSVNAAAAGDIVSVAGFSTASVNSTLADPAVTEPIKSTPIDPPTMSMAFYVNDSPLAGREGTMVTSTQIRSRLDRELESNVSMKMRLSENGEAFEVQARGELQLGILIEEMRREGFELSVSPPRVVYRNQDGTVHRAEPGALLQLRDLKALMEPIEEVTVDTPNGFAGWVIEQLNKRRGEMGDMVQDAARTRVKFKIPTRGLIGFRSELQHATGGEAVINNIFHSYVQYMGPIDKKDNGAIISNGTGTATTYALEGMEARGVLFISPGDEVYSGMVVGEHNRPVDIEVNPAKTKQLTNVRAAQKEEKTRLSPPRIMTLEEMMAYLRDDQVIEVTPKHLRLRMRELDPNLRKRNARIQKAELDK